MSQETLEDFGLKGMDHGGLTGVSLAVHAMPDAFLLMHTGVGCKHKATSQLSTHDWAEAAIEREAWTEVGDAELIRGSSERIGPYARSWLKRLDPGFMAVVSVTFIDLSGEDVVDEVAKVDAEAACPVRYVKVPGFQGDLWSGYAALLAEVVSEIDWSEPAADPHEVALLGYFFDRYEGDHSGNLQQIGAMLKGAGLTLGPVLFSGKPFTELKAAQRSGVVVQLPYARPAKRLKRSLKKRNVVHTELPMGIAGSSRWLCQVAEAAGTMSPRVEAFCRTREDKVREQIAKTADRWSAMRVAVFADVPLAVGLCGLLMELGLSPVVVGLRGHSLGGAEALREGLAALGHRLPDDVEVLENPSLHRTRTRCGELLEAERLDAVFGSATELNALSTLSPATWMRPFAGGSMQPQGPLMIEIGFPCKDWHATHALPFMGWGGVVILAQRILNAPRLWDARRRPAFHM